MKKQNIFLIISTLLITILFSGLTVNFYSKSVNQSNQETIEQNIPAQQTLPAQVQIIKTNVNNVDDGTITSKIIFNNSISGPVFVSLLDKQEVAVPGYLQKEAIALHDNKTYTHDNFIVPEGTYKLKVINETDEFITSDIIIRDKNDNDAPTFSEKPSIKVMKKNTLDDQIGQFDNDAEIYTSLTINDNLGSTINYVDAILYDESNHPQTLRTTQNEDNFSVSFDNLEPNKYSTEFLINYTNSSGDAKESYSNESVSVQSYDDLENPEAPISADIVVTPLVYNDYASDLNQGEIEVSVSILEKQLPVNSVWFIIGDQKIESEPSIEDPNNLTRDLYKATFTGLANGNHNIMAEISYHGGRISEHSEFKMYSKNTPQTTATIKEIITIDSLPGQDSGKIDVILDVITYNTIEAVSDDIKITNTTTPNKIHGGIQSLIKQEEETSSKEVNKRIKLSFDEVPPGTYDFEYTVNFIDSSSLQENSLGIQVEEFGENVPTYKSAEIEVTNNTWQDTDGQITTKVILDDTQEETQTEDYSIKFEIEDVEGVLSKVTNTVDEEFFVEETFEDLLIGDYKVKIEICEGEDEPEDLLHWNTILEEYITLIEQDRAHPTLLEVKYDLIKADYLETNGAIKNIEATFIDEDAFIDEVYFEIKSGDSLMDSKQAEYDDEKDEWRLPIDEMFVELEPFNYNLSVKTILLDSTVLEFSNLIKIEEQPNPDSMTDFKMLWILLGTFGGLVLIGGGFAYYYVRIK